MKCPVGLHVGYIELLNSIGSDFLRAGQCSGSNNPDLFNTFVVEILHVQTQCCYIESTEQVWFFAHHLIILQPILTHRGPELIFNTRNCWKWAFPFAIAYPNRLLNAQRTTVRSSEQPSDYPQYTGLIPKCGLPQTVFNHADQTSTN